MVGRTSLSPKHTVYLLKAGERVLIVGTGAQGPPSLLGELTDPGELRRFASERPDPPAPRPVVPGPSTVGFDCQVGADE